MSAAKHTPGPWIVATSNSWRRILGARSESVCEPIKQNDGHSDLYFRNGGSDGPDARLITAAPDLLVALRRLTTEYIFTRTMDGTSAEDCETMECVRAARSALAKATGEAA